MARFYFKYNGKEIWIDGLLRMALDTCIYNIKLNKEGDWDIMIIISGNRMVRTGKSTLGQLIGAYFSYRLGIPYTIKDIYFDSKELIEEAVKKPKHSINQYDEARRGLATTKRMSKVQEDLLDYFAECGQLNQVNIIVLPDFFKLNEEIAVARSEFLINVYRGERNIERDIYGEGKVPITEWDRGHFSLFNRVGKQILYDTYQSTKKKNYNAVRADFNGDFADFEVINKKEYSDKKFESLKKYQEDKEKKVKEHKSIVVVKKLVKNYAAQGLSDQKIADLLLKDWDFEISRMQINRFRHEETEGEV